MTFVANQQLLLYIFADNGSLDFSSSSFYNSSLWKATDVIVGYLSFAATCWTGEMSSPAMLNQSF